ncbi:MAG: hypothetical protein IJ184_01790 [Alphaproteobacteria bacterium]|nr:hypothetical protein [Alphaproteobacteria bacterium]
MLAALTATIFLSAVWTVYAVKFVVSSLNGISLFDAGILNAMLYVLFVGLPLLIGWMIFGFVGQTLYNARNSKNLNKLFAQMKKNQEYSDLLARIMLSSEQTAKNSFEMGRFDLLLADINELLSEFISRQRLASEEQIEYLWRKVQNGGKWSFGKVIIENFNRQPNFKQKVLVNVMADNVLAGTLLEFCARYQTIVGLLEKYDREKIFLDMIETGVMGKVFSILSPLAAELKRSRESKKTAFAAPSAELRTPEVSLSDSASAPSPVVEKKDKFSLAFERSFGNPVIEATPTDAPREPSLDATFADDDLSATRHTLDALKKEWGDSQPASPQDKADDLTYPFGGWTDAQNYKG